MLRRITAEKEASGGLQRHFLRLGACPPRLDQVCAERDLFEDRMLARMMLISFSAGPLFVK